MAKNSKRKGARVAATAKKSSTIKTKSVRTHSRRAASKVAKTPRRRPRNGKGPVAYTTQSEAQQASPSQLMFWPVLPLTMMTMWMAPMRAAFGR